MKDFRYSFAVILIALFVAGAVNAGQLSPILEDRLALSGPDEMIPVWIKLYRLEPVSQLKARSQRQAQTRAGRHQLVAEHFRTGHQLAQVELVEQLRAMNKVGTVKNIKQYWIVNAVATEVRASELKRLVARDDIEWIYPVVNPKLIEPVGTPSPLADPLADSITPNLTYIRADQASAMGYTGAGRLICSFDTGIDGNHPALFNQWKGHDGDSAAAWFDPRYLQTFPHAPAGTHGTHTMGIMVGRDTVTSYRVGVAPEAKWISAAVINIAGTSVIDAFQWAADPDGNPNTIADVPDVINHSWGYSKEILGCENMVFDLIDNTEALGIVNIFASGNRWQQGGADTIVFNPANRDLDSVDCFAVGNIDLTVFPPILYDALSGGSLGGPSDCNGGIKPNAVAPGTSITSCITGGSYGNMTGTSMAAPHVSGLVALLRQKNPNATPDEIKTAIINSTQSDGSWGALPNNSYGWGAIDCVAALAAIGDNLTDAPALRVYNFDHPAISPGDTVTGTITLQNLGEDALSVSATLGGSNPSLTVIDGSVSFGTIVIDSTQTSVGTVSVAVADTVTAGSRLSLPLSVIGANVSQNLTLYFNVGLPPEKGVASHDNGTIKFSLGNYGVVGLGPNSMFRAGGFGFTYNSTTNDLWEGGLMIGTGVTQVSAGIHSFFDRPDMDFKVIAGGDMVTTTPGTSGSMESYSAFNDDWANNPIGLTIRQHSFSYDYPNDDFIIVRYVLENFSGNSINGLYFGLLLDWDISGAATSNSGGYDNPNGVLWMAYNSAGSLSKFRGMKAIQGTQSGALTQSARTVSWLKIWSATANGYTDAEKWTSLIAGIPDTNLFEETRDDLFQMMNFGPFNLVHGDIDSVTVAILAGSSLADLVLAGEAAMLVPTDIDEGDDNPALPERFTLYQNYPNPFNPVTTIEFDLPTPAEYELAVFNILGQTVYETSGAASPGLVRVKWDASNQPSGVYFYRVKTGEFSASRKMVLMK